MTLPKVRKSCKYTFESAPPVTANFTSLLSDPHNTGPVLMKLISIKAVEHLFVFNVKYPDDC